MFKSVVDNLRLFMKNIIIFICTLFFLSACGQRTPSVNQQLTGKWTSDDDKQFQVVFKDSTKQDFYDGKLESTYRYQIRKDSLIAEDINSGDVFNYTIADITENHLTLIYLERGNQLKFSR